MTMENIKNKINEARTKLVSVMDLKNEIELALREMAARDEVLDLPRSEREPFEEAISAMREAEEGLNLTEQKIILAGQKVAAATRTAEFSQR